jgi:hypothetical protein
VCVASLARPEKSPAPKREFSQALQSDLGRPVPLAEINRFSPNAIDGYFRAVPPRQEGRMRYRHETRGGMRWTRHVRTTNDVVRGRRSRVVLTPRRWRQVGDDAPHPADDGDNKARSPRRARRKPLKPLRREGRTVRRTCGDYTRVLFHFARETNGCLLAPGFPCALRFASGLSSSTARARGAARRPTHAHQLPLRCRLIVATCCYRESEVGPSDSWLTAEADVGSHRTVMGIC